MRVCMFVPALSPWSPGGVAEHAYQLSKQLVQLGCEVHVVCKSARGRDKYEVVDGIQVHHLVHNKGPPWLFLMKKSLINSFAEQWNFDVFHSQAPCAAFIHVDKPLVVTLHGTSADEAKEVFRDLVDLPRLGIWNFNAYFLHSLAVPSTYLPTYFLKRTIKQATRVIAVSQFVKRQAQTIYHAAPEKVDVVYNGAKASPAFFSDQKIEEQIILYVGYLGVRKGLPYLLTALHLILKENLKAKAVIVGNGSLRSLCQYMARKLNISNRISFTGVVTEEEKKSWYQKATLCVVPSTYEPFPMVVLEALAAGRPVIASNVGGIPEVIKDDVNGLLVRPRDPKQIAEAVNKILSDENLARKMSENAVRTIAEEFNWERIARKTLSIYRSCIGEAT